MCIRDRANAVAAMAELRILNLQAFDELKAYNDTGKFLYKHPLLKGKMCIRDRHKGRLLFMTLIMLLGIVSLLQMLSDPTSTFGIGGCLLYTSRHFHRRQDHHPLTC